ncbi:MAG: DUF3237 domain-containing protein [Dehalococcoidia bacterium]
MTDYREPELEHLYDMHVDLDAPHPIGQTPAGNRQTWIVTGGTFEGPKLKGDVLPGGGDWALIRSDGAVQLDVRATAKTDDGAHIHAFYRGLIIMSSDVLQRVFSAEDVPLDEYYFYTNPMFQTGAEKYAWINDLMAVGRGKVIPGGVEYRVWALR